MREITQAISAASHQSTLAPAICRNEGYLSYLEIVQYLAIISNYFFDRGLKPGAKVVVNIADPDLYLITGLACIHCGLLPFMTAAPASIAEIENIDAVIGSPLPMEPDVAPDLILDDTVLAGKLANIEMPDPVDCEDDDLVMINSTTGTTGAPTLVPVSKSRALAWFQSERYSQAQRVMSTIGQGSLHGVTSRIRQLIEGKAIVRGDGGTLDALKMINLYAVDTLLTTPKWIENAMALMDEHSIQCPSVKDISLTGSLFSASLVDKITDRFQARMRIGYGISELGGIASGPIDPKTYRAGYVGQIRKDLKMVAANSGREGAELSVFLGQPRGVYRDGEVHLFSNQFYKLPDLGFVEDDALYLTGRSDEVFNFSGNKLPFSTLTNQITQEIAIEDIAVLNPDGADDPLALHIAIVDPRSECTDDALLDIVEKLIGMRSVKSHIRIHRVPHIPRNDMGKVDRIALRALL